MNTPTTVVEDYLHRLAIDHTPLADLATLRALHRTHLATVPLEDLGECEDTALTLPGLLDRITQQRRGAPATQLNLAFAMLLVGLGFTVTPLTVTPNRRDDPRSVPRMALSVHIGSETYLVDVSGAGPSSPLLLEDGQQHGDSSDMFEIRPTDGDLEVQAFGELRYKVGRSRQVMDVFAFDALVRLDATHPRTRTIAPVVSIRRQRGQTTLIGSHLIETNGTARTDILLSPAQGLRAMRERFGVVPTPQQGRCLCDVFR